MADGQVPTPGSWNRVQIAVEDLAETVAGSRARGAGSAMRS